MQPISEQNLKSELKRAEKNIYILFGNDGYLKRFYADKITDMYVEKNDVFNFQNFSADCELQEVYDAVLQFPVMSDKKVVILTDFDFEKCKKSDFDKLCTLLGEVPDSCIFILLFDMLEISAKKNSKLNKLMTLAVKNNGLTAELNHRTLPELIKVLQNGAKKRGCSIDDSTARYLVETVGQDISTLQNELCKLCAFTTKGEITKKTVDAVSVKTVEASVYALSKQIIEHNMTAALKTLDELFYLKVEPIIILSTISGYYVDMYRAFLGKERGMTASDIAKEFGYFGREFVIRNAMRDVKGFDYKKFELSFDALRLADKTLKSFSGDGRTALERLIVKLGFIALKGEDLD